MWRWLLVLACFYFALQTARQGRASAGPVPGWPTHVTGYGRTVAEAKDEAVKHLIDDLDKFLAEQSPPLVTWRPNPDWVKRHLIRDQGDRGADGHIDGVGPTKTWIYPTRAPDLDLLRSLDQKAQRLARSQTHMALAARVLAGWVLVLAAVTVYFKVRGVSRRQGWRAAANYPEKTKR